jgi:hypothetical protein
VEFEEEDDEVMFEMEKGPRERLPSQTQAATKYRSRWMRRKPANTMVTQTSLTWEEPEVLSGFYKVLRGHISEMQLATKI